MFVAENFAQNPHMYACLKPWRKAISLSRRTIVSILYLFTYATIFWYVSNLVALCSVVFFCCWSLPAPDYELFGAIFTSAGTFPLKFIVFRFKYLSTVSCVLTLCVAPFSPVARSAQYKTILIIVRLGKLRLSNGNKCRCERDISHFALCECVSIFPCVVTHSA